MSVKRLLDLVANHGAKVRHRLLLVVLHGMPIQAKARPILEAVPLDLVGSHTAKVHPVLEAPRLNLVGSHTAKVRPVLEAARLDLADPLHCGPRSQERKIGGLRQRRLQQQGLLPSYPKPN